MAVKLEGSIKRWIGLSSDVKPQPGQSFQSNGSPAAVLLDSDVPAGSSFLESDTGLVWRWNGIAWLAPPPPSDAGVMQLAVLADELLRIRRLLETVNELDSNDLL